MSRKKILSLDLSTSCTGWAVFNTETKELVDYGSIKSSSRGTSKLCKLDATLVKMLAMANEILALVNRVGPDKIIIEEIAGSKNRLGQKTLDGFHWIVLLTLRFCINDIIFYDVTGASGWRTHLRLRLTDADKEGNKEAKKLNKKLMASQRLPIIGPKHLACRYVKSNFGIDFDPDKDNDIADAITMGHAFLIFRFTELAS